MSDIVRTRFAPSPTGYLHVGGVRTALFAWLVARQKGGQFVLRIEDTDRARFVEGAEQHIMDSLNALGLTYDEGPDKGGQYGPYRQSERLDTYKPWAQKLIDAGRAYADPYTPEQIQKFREEAQAAKIPYLYRNNRPDNPPVWDGSMPLRFKSDPKAYIRTDTVMGELSTGPETIDDFILVKSDGYPTYNFAHIIDDAEMQITHIIRGQEFLSSIPNYLNLYEALDITPPIMATMPHILGPDGKKKLSKRDGAKDVLDYIREGFLPEALLNFIASLGWNDGTEQEIFSLVNLIELFSLDRVQKSGARFDEQRLLWMNGAHIRELTLDDLYTRTVIPTDITPVIPTEVEGSVEQISRQARDDSTKAQDNNLGFWPKEAQNYDESYRKQVLGLVQERLKFFAEIPQLTDFFFVDLPINPELISGNKQLSKLSTDEVKNLLDQAKTTFEQSDFTVEDLQNRLNQLLETTGQKPGILFSLIRIATTQAPFSPSLADTMAVLGKERSLARINAQLSVLST